MSSKEQHANNTITKKLAEFGDHFSYAFPVINRQYRKHRQRVGESFLKTDHGALSMHSKLSKRQFICLIRIKGSQRDKFLFPMYAANQ